MKSDEIKTQLDELAEALADLALDALRERDPQTERLYTRARRAVEKASHLISGIRAQDES